MDTAARDGMLHTRPQNGNTEIRKYGNIETPGNGERVGAQLTLGEQLRSAVIRSARLAAECEHLSLPCHIFTAFRCRMHLRIG